MSEQVGRDAMDPVRVYARSLDGRFRKRPRLVVARDLVAASSLRDVLAKHMSGDGFGPPLWEETLAAVEGRSS